jgi:Transaldolase
MRFFIDTGSVAEVEEIAAWGILSGATTNPSLLAKESGDPGEIVRRICDIVGGPVSAEVVSDDVAGMVDEGRALAKLHEHVVVKVPFSSEGLAATRALSAEGIRVNMTLVFSANQALLSAGASSILAVGGAVRAWEVDLRSMTTGARLARLRVSNGAVGTSGAGEQYVEVDGVRYGHVIDPRTGWPASGVLSASVIAKRAAVADALSTAFLIGGTDLAESYCRTHPNVLALVTPDDGSNTPLAFGSFNGATVELA